MSSSRRRRGSVHEDLNAPRIAAQALQEHATDRYNLVRAVVGAIEACDVGRGNAVFCIGTAGCDLLLYEEFVRSGVFLPETAAQATSVSLAIPGLDPSKSYELTTQLHNRKLWRVLRQMGVLMFKDYDTDVNSLDFRVECKNVNTDSGADDSEPSFERDPTPPEAPRPPLHPDDLDFDELHLERPASPLYYEDPRPSSRAGPSARYERTFPTQQDRTRPPITKSAPAYRRGSVSFDKRPSSFDNAGSPPFAGPPSDAPRMQSASFRKKPGMADFQTGQTPVRRERRYSLYDQY
ncbi:uncharacterized protein JCM10292_003327 [Rhodotorula paludigena]|uniref:uncharacterized protein n=1 Tax=Rhodotorula paludigena TaxID=86838 RepID=UPI00317E39AD